MSKRIMKYNPAFLTDEELLNSFAVRQTDFDIIMRIIRENTTNVNQHVLVIGPRGIGKTTLLLRIGLEARTAEDLKHKWYPLVFAEESYSICSVGEFWLETLFHVAQQTGDKKWEEIIKELNNEKDDKRLGERALAKLMDFSDSRGKRLLLIVENFNMLFDGQISDQDAWALRHTLINEPRIMLLASATSRMDQVDNSGSAMYELFKQHDLKPLEKDECIAVWEAVTGQLLKDDRIRPIQILTGGNPRLLSIISSFGSKLSFQDLMGDLLNLVDDNTEYFKSHLDNLPPIERKAYLALAELWDPSPAKDIARLARLDVNKTSSLMARLVNRGAVKVSEQSKRTKLYQTTERMYNIYYLMRKRGAPSERVKAVVNFMVSFYGHDELMDVTRSIAEEACDLAPELCRDHFVAYDAILKKLSSEEIKSQLLTSAPIEFIESMQRFFPEYSNLISNAQNEVTSGSLPIMSKDIEKETIDKLILGLKTKVKTNPKDHEAWALLGYLFHSVQQYDKAKQAFIKASKGGKQFVFHWIVLANIAYSNMDTLKTYSDAVYRGQGIKVSIEELIKFFIVEHELPDLALVLAKFLIESSDGTSEALNSAAWAFYKYANGSCLKEASEWIIKAIAINPKEDAFYQHTYACILCAMNRGDEALAPAQKYFQNSKLASEEVDDTIELFAALTAAGCGRQALDILVKSPAAGKVEPLIVGIKLYLGEEVRVATEILEIAKDVKGRIQSMRNKIDEREALKKATKPGPGKKSSTKS